MLAFVLSVDERPNEIENLGFFSYNDIKIFDKSLSDYQVACLEFGEKIEKINVKNSDILTVKKYIEQSDEDYSVFFYENSFFDFSVTDLIKNLNKSIGFVGHFYECDYKFVFSIIDNDKFKLCLMNKHSLNSVKELLKSCCLVIKPTFYHTFLDTYYSYKKLHFDVLNGKTNVLLPSVAGGIHTYGNLPKGDYTIIPPVYISENSQIEQGSVIGPCTVVTKNTLIAKNSRISKGILCENSYISEDCIIENSICGKNSSVKRGAAILNNCVIGFDSLIGDGMFIENRAVVLPEIQAYSFINEIKNDIKLNSEKICFSNLDVVSACKLGACFGNVFKSPSVCVASDDNNYCKTVKLAFISGLCSSGCDCFDIGSSFLSKLFYTALFCQLNFCFYFSINKNTVFLEIYNENCEKLNVVSLYNLLFIYRKQKKEFIAFKDVKKVKQIRGISKVYLRDLKNLLPAGILNEYKILSDCLTIDRLLKQLLKTNKITNNSMLNIEFFIDISDNKLSLVNKNKSFCHDDLLNAVEFLKLYENTDSLISKLYKKDALVLLLMIISYVDISTENLHNFLKNLEKMRTVEREYVYKDSIGKFLNNFLFNKKIEYKNGNVCIMNIADNWLLKLNPSAKKIKLITKFSDAAASEELFKDLDALIDDINKM